MLQFTVTETNTEGNPPIGTTNKRWDFLSPPVMSTGAATLQVNYSRSVKSSIRWSIETGCLGLSLSREDLLRVVGGRGGPVTLVVGGKNAPHTESYKAYWCQ